MLVYVCTIEDPISKIAGVCNPASQEDADFKIPRMFINFQTEVEIGKTYSAIPKMRWVYSNDKEENLLCHGKILDNQSIDELGQYIVD